MNQFTIGKKITGGFVAVLILVGALGVFSAFKLHEIKASTEYLQRDPWPGTVSVYEVEAAMKGSFGRALSYTMATKEERTKILQDMANDAKDAEKFIADYEANITAAEDRAMFDQFKQERATYLKNLSGVQKLADEGKTAELNTLVQQGVIPAFSAI
jgi:hypothetical protein